MSSLKIIHLSDLHFYYPNFSWSQFKSKEWLGNLNSFLFRKQNPMRGFSKLLNQLEIDAIAITGDLTTTSHNSEFQLAKEFIATLPIKPFYLPGNHDVYTPESDVQKRFYAYLEDTLLKTKKVSLHPIKENWVWIGLDCALPTPYFCAYGFFSQTTEKELLSLLSSLSSDVKIVLGNHYPLFYSKGAKHDLRRREALEKICRNDKRIKLYLHGHDHKPYLFYDEEGKLPLVINTGSSTLSTQTVFHLLEIKDARCFVLEAIRNKSSKKEVSWTLEEKGTYFLR